MKKRAIVLSSIVASALMVLSGCGSSGGNTPPATDTTVSGKAVDGYLVNSFVCLDLSMDGYCQADSEPLTTTDANGSYSLTVTPEQQKDENYSKASILVVGGYDSDTNKRFEGKLEAPFNDGEGQIYVTPVTTMVAAMVKSGKTEAEAKSTVAKVLDINESLVNQDPVALKATDDTLIKAALQLQKSIEVLAQAKVNAGVKEDKAVADIYASLAQKAQASSDANLSGLIDDVVNADDDFSADIGEGAKAVAEHIGDMDDFSSTAKIGVEIERIQTKIKEQVIDANGSDVDFGSIIDFFADKDLATMHAYDLMEISDVHSSNPAALATKIATALTTAGMEDELLPFETEIATLKANSDAEVQSVGIQLEEIFQKEKLEMENAKDIASAEAIKITIPSTYYSIEKHHDGLEYTAIGFSSDKVLFNEFAWDPTQNKFVADTDDDASLVWKDGAWTNTQNEESVAYTNDNATVTLGGNFQVEIVKEIDPNTDFRIQNDLQSAGLDINFTSAAKGYLLAMKSLENRYELFEKESKHDGSGEGYSSLVDFIQAQSNGWFDGDEQGGVGFESSVTTLKAGDSGQLVHRHSTDEGPQTDGIAGTWEAVELPGSSALAIVTHNDYNDDMWQTMFAVYDGAVYRGDFTKKSDSAFVGEVMFNQAAFDEFKAALSTATSDGSSASSSSSTDLDEALANSQIREGSISLGGKTFFVVGKDDNGKWLTQVSFNDDATSVTETAIEGDDDEDGTRGVVFDGKNKLTFPDNTQVVFMYNRNDFGGIAVYDFDKNGALKNNNSMVFEEESRGDANSYYDYL